MARASASGSARTRRAVGAAALVWGLLLAPSAGCGADAARGASPMEDQLGDPKVPLHHRGEERRGAEPTVPVEPARAPMTSQE